MSSAAMLVRRLAVWAAAAGVMAWFAWRQYKDNVLPEPGQLVNGYSGYTWWSRQWVVLGAAAAVTLAVLSFVAAAGASAHTRNRMPHGWDRAPTPATRTGALSALITAVALGVCVWATMAPDQYHVDPYGGGATTATWWFVAGAGAALVTAVVLVNTRRSQKELRRYHRFLRRAGPVVSAAAADKAGLGPQPERVSTGGLGDAVGLFAGPVATFLITQAAGVGMRAATKSARNAQASALDSEARHRAEAAEAELAAQLELTDAKGRPVLRGRNRAYAERLLASVRNEVRQQGLMP